MKFEDNLKALETLVSKMESGGMGLDDMIAAYEQGRKLVDDCQKELNLVQQRIEKVTKSGQVEKLEA